MHYRTCNLCDSLCGLEIKHTEGEILSIRGNKEDVFSQGHICPKAVALQDIHFDKDRLRHPVEKTKSGWKAISWDQAYEKIAHKIQVIRKQYGNDAISFFYGTPVAQEYTAQLVLDFLKRTLKSKNIYSTTSLDSLPEFFNALQLFGNRGLLPLPDIEYTDFMICLGGNPIVSNGSFMASGNMAKHLKDVKLRGELIVIDPRYTESSRVATQHIFIRPGSDVYLLLALIHCVFKYHKKKTSNLPNYIKNTSELEHLASSFPPERIAEKTGIKGETIIKLCQRFCDAPTAVIYSRMGVCASEFSTLNNLLITALHIITGNFDRRGGIIFNQPAVDLAGLAHFIGATGSFNKFQSRISKLPEFEGELPAAVFAEEVLSNGPGKIRALITCAANIALSIPNTKSTLKALKQLDYMVAVDYYINETTQYADIILPPHSPLEKSNFNLALGTIMTRNVSKYSPALFKTKDDTYVDGDILLNLATHIGSNNKINTFFNKTLAKGIRKIGFDGVVSLLTLIGPYGKLSIDFYGNKVVELLKLILKTPLLFIPGILKGIDLAEIKRHKNGLRLPEAQSVMPQRLATPDKKIDLMPKLYDQQIARLERLLNHTKLADNEFFLIGRRDILSHNSWLHNSKRLTKGKNRCYVIMHQEDAQKLGIIKNNLVTVSSPLGKIVLPVAVGEDIMRGVISIPHGWGHDHDGNRMHIAKSVAGVPVNAIIDNTQVDCITGMSKFNGTKVQVEVK